MILPIDPDWFSIPVCNLSDAEPEAILRKRAANKRPRKERPPDTRPMCDERYVATSANGPVLLWHCPHRATVSFRGKPLCRIHEHMRREAEAEENQRHDAVASAVEISLGTSRKPTLPIP